MFLFHLSPLISYATLEHQTCPYCQTSFFFAIMNSTRECVCNCYCLNAIPQRNRYYSSDSSDSIWGIYVAKILRCNPHLTVCMPGEPHPSLDPSVFLLCSNGLGNITLGTHTKKCHMNRAFGRCKNARVHSFQLQCLSLINKITPTFKLVISSKQSPLKLVSDATIKQSNPLSHRQSATPLPESY